MTDVLFIHHSVGRHLIGDGRLRERLSEHTPTSGVRFFDIDYRKFGTHGPDGTPADLGIDIPGDNTDPDGLYRLLTAPECRTTLAKITAFDVVVHKSCYPASQLPDETALRTRIALYESILDAAAAQPTAFLFLTPPPLTSMRTSTRSARNAAEFATWLREEASRPPNVDVFDLHQVLRSEGSRTFGTLNPSFRSRAPVGFPSKWARAQRGCCSACESSRKDRSASGRQRRGGFVVNERVNSAVMAVARRLLRHHVEELYVTAPTSETPRPTIFVSNHQAYWDGFAALLVASHLRCKLRLQVSSVVTGDFPFLRRIGVNPVDETDQMAVLQALADDARFLGSAPNAGLWMFVQGRYQRADDASRYFRGGIAHLIKRAPGAAVVPVALRYDLLRTRRPVLYVDIGADIAAKVRGLSRRTCVLELEAAHAELYAEQTRALERGGGEYIGLLGSRNGTHACGRYFYTADVRRQLHAMSDVEDADVRVHDGGFVVDIRSSHASTEAVVAFLIDRYSLEHVPRQIVEGAFTMRKGTA